MRRLLPLLMVIFIIASLAIFLFGDSGLVALTRREHYRENLAANVSALDTRHQALEAELAQLKANRDTTIALARGLGLYAPGDKIVQLEGRVEKGEVYAMGDLLKMNDSDGTRSSIFKMSAFIAAALLILAAVILTRAPRRKPLGHHGR